MRKMGLRLCLRIEPSFSSANVALNANGTLFLSDRKCTVDITTTELGSLLIAIPSGEIDRTTETVNGSTVITIVNAG